MCAQKKTISGLLAGVGILLSSCTGNIEKVPYTIVEKHGSFEIREYAPHLVAETTVDADFDQAGNIAFRRLFGYISGANRSQASIAMTAPVNQQALSEKIAMTAPVNMRADGSRYTVSFIMPAEYNRDTLPEPTDQNVAIREVEKFKAAAIRYSGTWSQHRYEAKKAELENFMSEKGLAAQSRPIFARYDPPFQLWFLRRNEVVIPIK